MTDLTQACVYVTKDSKRGRRRGFLALAKKNNGLLSMCDQGIVSLTNFLTSLIIGRCSSKEELGLYILGWTLATFATDISAALVATPYTVLSPQLGVPALRRYRGSALGHQVVLGGASMMVIGAAAVIFTKGYSLAVGRVLSILAAAVIPIILRDLMRRLCFAHLKMSEACLLDVIGCSLQIAGLTCCAYLRLLTATTAYVFVGVTSVVFCFLWLAGNRRTFSLSTRSAFADLRVNWPLARWILASAIVWAIAMYLYPWFLTLFHGTPATGIWAACYGVVALGNPVLLGFGNYVAPKVANVYAERGTAHMRTYVYRSSLRFFLLLFPLCGILLCKGGILVAIVYGQAYSNNATAVSLLAVNLLLSAVTFPYSRGLFVLNRAKADLIVNLLGIALLFSAGLELIRIYSVVGAAASLAVSNSAMFIVRICVFERACSVARKSSDASIGLALQQNF
jgi:O-antigen/teichoic acid export membrane protein